MEINPSTLTPELHAALLIHNAISNDDGFMGYGGDPESFHSLLEEVEEIAISEMDNLRFNAESIVNRFFEIQTEIEEGKRDPAWYA